MGVLAATEGRTASVEPEPQGPAPESPEPNPGDQGDGRRRAEDGTFVSAAQLVPEKPSRRAQARADVEETINARLKEYETRTAGERAQYEQRLRDSDDRLRALQDNFARTQGALEEMRSRPAPQAQQQAQGPDPDELHRQGQAALAQNNFDEWQRLTRQAMRIEARREAEGFIKPQFDALKADLEKRIPQPIAPEVQYLINTHPNVARNGQMGTQAVLAEAQRLAIYRRDIAPEQRLPMAFDLAEKALTAGQQAPGRPQGFDQSAATALSSVPSGRGSAPAGNGGTDGVQLDGLQESTWRKAGFSSAAEYVKWGDPGKYNLIK